MHIKVYKGQPQFIFFNKINFCNNKITEIIYQHPDSMFKVIKVIALIAH